MSNYKKIQILPINWTVQRKNEHILGKNQQDGRCCILAQLTWTHPFGRASLHSRGEKLKAPFLLSSQLEWSLCPGPGQAEVPPPEVRVRGGQLAPAESPALVAKAFVPGGGRGRGAGVGGRGSGVLLGQSLRGLGSYSSASSVSLPVPGIREAPYTLWCPAFRLSLPVVVNNQERD